MDKLIEVSIRGSVFYYLGKINTEQLARLNQFGSLFYHYYSECFNQADERIAKIFTDEVEKLLDIILIEKQVDTVITIK